MGIALIMTRALRIADNTRAADHNPYSDRIAFTIAGILTLCLLGVAIGSTPKGTAYAQEDSSSDQTAIGTTPQDDRTTLSEIKNMTTTELTILKEINVTSTKLATQGAYTALSV